MKSATKHRRLLRVTAAALACAVASLCASARADKVLCDFHKPGDTSFVLTQLNGAQASAEGLLMEAGKDGANVAVKIRPAQGVWDASEYSRIVFDIENQSTLPAKIRIRALNPGGTDWQDSATAEGFVPAGKRISYTVYLYRKEEDQSRYPELRAFSGMRGLPGGFQSHWRTIDPADVRAIDFEVISGKSPQKLVLHSIRAAESVVPELLSKKGREFFPFVDKYGQYRWAEWEGKVKTDAELLASHNAEIDDLKNHPPLKAFDKFGGFRSGQKLEARTYFHTARVNGRWWLVDPEGYLFWSHGANSVGHESASTRVSERTNYFADLPPQEGRFADAWGRASDGDLRFDHLKANLIRLFGPAYVPTMIGLHNDRLQSWGLNTIGAWSSQNVIAQHRVPYTAILHPSWPAVRPRVPDVYAPDFEKRMTESVAKAVGTAAGDAWCIGFFIDNELQWETNPLDFIGELLASRPDAYTKRQFVAQLRAQNDDIRVLNDQLGTQFENWAALEQSKTAIKAKQLEQADAIRTLSLAFYADIAKRYFHAADLAIREAAPGQLYLGCRMHVQNKLLVEVAAKYCDVLSFNRYENSVKEFDPFGIDLPVLVSEFHFGALDAGMLGTGLRPASDRYDRAAKYVDYVEGALTNPRIVGTHWFAYCPQAITGRDDGENFNTGLFDTCNQPYPEMREALRKIGSEMYEKRLAD